MAKRYLHLLNIAVLFWLSGLLLAGALEVRAAEEVVELNARVVLIGASYAEDWPIARIGNEYDVLNVGIGGQESSEMLQRFEADVVSHTPTAVVIWGFINDFFRSAADEADETKSEIKANFTSMIQIAKENGIQPIVATEVTMGIDGGLTGTIRRWIGSIRGKQSYQSRINSHVREMNDWLREHARKEGLVLLDLEHALYGSDGERKSSYGQEDGSHISPAGYEALSQYALPVLQDGLVPVETDKQDKSEAD